MKTTLKIEVTDSSEIEARECFGGSYCLHPQSKQVSKHEDGDFINTKLPYLPILKMETKKKN
jgi:hypothetical protein